jgi:hypothetical protein
MFSLGAQARQAFQRLTGFNFLNSTVFPHPERISPRMESANAKFFFIRSEPKSAQRVLLAVSFGCPSSLLATKSASASSEALFFYPFSGNDCFVSSGPAQIAVLRLMAHFFFGG